MLKIKKSNTQMRLLYLMGERKLKQKDILDLTANLCELYDVKFNKSDISQYVSGKTEPNQDKLYILSEALCVNVVWLMGFDVPMDNFISGAVGYDEKDIPTECQLREQIKATYGEKSVDLLETYSRLDEGDRGKLEERAEMLLESEKYNLKKAGKQA